MSDRLAVGIDLGGTNIKAGLIAPDDVVRLRNSIETQADLGFEHVFARLVALIRQIAADASLPLDQVQAIGVGVPGPMSRAKGLIYHTPNLPGWHNVPLRDRLCKALGRPAVLENDANAAAFGEFVAGAGRGIGNLVLLTLGTGIGGGIVLDGRVLHGAYDNAAEIGHTIVVPDGRPCPCGQRGCLERYSSANAVAERLVEAVSAGESSSLAERVRAGATLDSVAVEKAAAAGDALAQRIWDEACRCLAITCVNLQHTLNPQRVILGGGLIAAGDRLINPVRAHCERLRWNIAPDAPDIVPATLGNDAGIIGAAAIARAETPSAA